MAKFFTKKVCLIILVSVVALSGIIWAIVANLTPKFRSGINAIPAANYVSGNGTASVMVDDYLYFVGDSVKISDLSYGDNEYYAKGVMPDAGIFRVKIGTNNKPVLDYQYDNSYIDENTNEKKEWQVGDAEYNSVVVGVKDWESIGKKNNGIEAVVPKIAGHDKTAMWVFGKYLIYVTPHNRYDNRGNLMSDYLDFFRVDLDGKNHTLIYTTDSTDLTTKNFTVWADSRENIYLIVNETDNKNDKPETKIKKINVITQKIDVLDRSVSNVVLPTATQYGKQNESLAQVYGGVMGYVYYTKTRGENATARGNIMYRCSINGGKVEEIGNSGSAEEGTTFTPMAVTPVDTEAAHASAQFVFAISVSSQNVSTIEKDLCVITNQNYLNYSYQNPIQSTWVKKDFTIGIYANNFCTIDNKLYHYSIAGDRIVLDQENGEAKKLASSVTVDSVLAVMGDDIYVQSGSTIYKVNKNGTMDTISTNTSTSTDENENNDEDTDSTENKTDIALPVAVLYQPQGNTGDSLIFVQDTKQIRLFHTDQKYDYLRFKNS